MSELAGRPNALVTGGAGFVGSSLVRILQNSGYAVTVYDNLASGRAEYMPEGIELVKADIRNEAEFASTVERVKPTVIFHTAAIHYIPYCNAHPQEAMQVNVEGTEVVVRIADLAMVPRLVFCSTAAVYPAVDIALNEVTVLPGPTDIYGYTKLFGEELIRWRQKSSQTRFVIARLFNVFGPRETSPHLIPAMLKQMLAGVDKIMVGNIEPKRDYVYVDEIAMSLFKLGSQPLPDTDKTPVIANICTGKEYSVREVLQALQAAIGTNLQIEQDPDRIRPSDRPHLLGDPGRLRELVGYAPQKAFTDGLEELVAWAQDNPHLMVG